MEKLFLLLTLFSEIINFIIIRNNKFYHFLFRSKESIILNYNQFPETINVFFEGCESFESEPETLKVKLL